MSTMRPQHLLKARENGATIERSESTRAITNFQHSSFFRQYGYPWGSFFIIAQKQAGKDAVYVIKEAAKPGVTAAANMVVAFPVYEFDQTSRRYVSIWSRRTIDDSFVS